MTRIEERADFLREIGRFIIIAKDRGINLMAFYYHRTTREQQAKYVVGRRGREGEKIITNCDGVIKKSEHQKWLALDFVIISDDGLHLVWNDKEKYAEAGKIWTEMGHTWGGSWKSIYDPYHFQY